MKPGPQPDPSETHGEPNADAKADGLSFALENEARQCAGLGIDPQLFERALFAGAKEFLSRPGKAFRARLVEASYGLAGGLARQPPRAALEAIELLHAGSLIVDDIQDDAEERRGAPALHRQLGMPRALNVGNWLYFVALSKLDELELEPERALATTRAAHRCFLRCHEGQALDLALNISELKRAEVPAVAHTTSQLKTGALMAFAARLGALVAQARAADVEALARFGERTGTVLQMLDDLGAFVAPERQDKALEDLRGQRVNWVWAWAAESLDQLSYKQLSKQVGRGEQLVELKQRLAQAVEPLGRARVRLAVGAAMQELEGAFSHGAALEALAAELARLEQSYG
ncbi:MAG: polyprenyl synthetase family protein [Myxococcales bacterium]